MDWLRQNELNRHEGKRECMFICNDKQLSKISEIVNIKIDIDGIKRVSKERYLGLTIDESLFWNQQY